MRGSIRFAFALSLLLALLAAAPPARAADLVVTAVTPHANAMAAPGTNLTVTFDRAVNPATVTSGSFRVFGRSSGTATGSFAFGNGNQTVTFTPADPFSCGEPVTVNLSEAILAADGAPLRQGGWCWSFMAASAPAAFNFQQLDVLSNTNGPQTRIYGASSSDLDEDGFIDLTTINEVSADVRVLLNLGDGTGSFGDYLTPQPVGIEASPNDTADFDNDGHADLCLSASSSDSVWVLLGHGDGTFGPVTGYPVGDEPHGIVPLDVDGDGDRDIVNANFGSNNLSLLVNDGTGHFAPATFFSGGVNGEYGLAGGDMDGDGLADLVVAGNAGQTIRVLTANGNGGFTMPDPAISSGGPTWVIALGDLDGDGDLDATASNSFSGNGAVLLGNGNGTFAAAVLTSLGAHTPSTDLADLDGDGDLDWILSSYGGGFWRIYANNGAGTFTFQQQINAPSNPSCAVPFDMDNDGDVDLGLTDEIADVVVLRENVTAWADVGHALGGEHGDPFGTGAGSLVGGTALTLKLSNARANAATWLVAGLSALNAPFKGGLLVPKPDVVVAFNSGPAGALSLPTTWPAGVPAGNKLSVQWWIADPAGPVGFAASNAVTGTTALSRHALKTRGVLPPRHRATARATERRRVT